MANVTYRIVQVDQQDETEHMADEINIAAMEGWEVVGFTPKFGASAYYCLLKRTPPKAKVQQGGLPQYQRDEV
ncbi:MAG TPA: hypothetical protein VG204_13825 [Terriglobia bacterium]|nr:hypothetical protein [Terriglobia bacterium]